MIWKQNWQVRIKFRVVRKLLDTFALESKVRIYILTGDVLARAARPTNRDYSCSLHSIQGGPAKVKPTLLVTFECAGKIQ